MAERSLITIPARTEASRCRSCNGWIYWVKTPKGNNLPVSVDREIEGHAYPTYRSEGRGYAHFADCPQADHWRGRKRGK